MFSSIILRISFPISETPDVGENNRLAKTHTSTVARIWEKPAAQVVHIILGLTPCCHPVVDDDDDDDDKLKSRWL